jgi:hypothetical protein
MRRRLATRSWRWPREDLTRRAPLQKLEFAGDFMAASSGGGGRRIWDELWARSSGGEERLGGGNE